MKKIKTVDDIQKLTISDIKRFRLSSTECLYSSTKCGFVVTILIDGIRIQNRYIPNIFSGNTIDLKKVLSIFKRDLAEKFPELVKHAAEKNIF